MSFVFVQLLLAYIKLQSSNCLAKDNEYCTGRGGADGGMLRYQDKEGGGWGGEGEGEGDNRKLQMKSELKIGILKNTIY